jgi:hypothetical protein
MRDSAVPAQEAEIEKFFAPFSKFFGGEMKARVMSIDSELLECGIVNRRRKRVSNGISNHSVMSTRLGEAIELIEGIGGKRGHEGGNRDSMGKARSQEALRTIF